jgi:hypothetical protein
MAGNPWRIDDRINLAIRDRATLDAGQQSGRSCPDRTIPGLALIDLHQQLRQGTA